MSRYNLIAFVLACLLSTGMQAQELFVYSEPASNMPVKALGMRVSNWMMDETNNTHINYHCIPELMLSVNKHLMIHAEVFFSNRKGGMTAEGGGLYAKYRFYSADKVYRHFRMAAFGRATTNNGDIHQEELMTNGHNTGYQLGIIGTQLLHKTALSASTYYEQATDNRKGNEFPTLQTNKAMNYVLSAGRLVLPKSYTGYKQTNLNIMVELLGQSLLGNGKQYVDIAPAIQLIFNSQTRFDVGYRQQLYSNMQRTAPNGILIRAEHLLYKI